MVLGNSTPRKSGGKDQHAKATAKRRASGARRCHPRWHRTARSLWRWCSECSRPGPGRLRSSATSISTTTRSVRTRSAVSIATWTVPSRRLRRSPFVAGGAGTGAAGGLASQGAVAVTNDGRFLIAVDAGSNQLSVLRIQQDGDLQLVPNGVVSSDGPTPVSVAVHDGLVYVANAAASWTELHRVHAVPVWTAPAAGQLDCLPSEWLAAWRCPLQLDGYQPGRDPGGNLGDRQLCRWEKRAFDRGCWRALHRSGAWAFR